MQIRERNFTHMFFDQNSTSVLLSSTVVLVDLPPTPPLACPTSTGVHLQPRGGGGSVAETASVRLRLGGWLLDKGVDPGRQKKKWQRWVVFKAGFGHFFWPFSATFGHFDHFWRFLANLSENFGCLPQSHTPTSI